MPLYFRPDGSFNRKAIDAQARVEWRAALGYGATGETATFAYWLRYVWRVARGKRQLAAFSIVENAARAAMAERELRRLP